MQGDYISLYYYGDDIHANNTSRMVNKCLVLGGYPAILPRQQPPEQNCGCGANNLQDLR